MYLELGKVVLPLQGAGHPSPDPDGEVTNNAGDAARRTTMAEVNRQRQFIIETTAAAATGS